MEILDIPYKKIDGVSLYMDLFLPDDAQSVPLIMWIHGGAWKKGDRKWCGLKNQTARGFAVASIDYRLTTVAPFPACIEDCKSALVFLRENASKYSIDPSRVCVAGDSAGGHLAALMGVSSGHADWEPENADCSVQAVIDFYGPSQMRRDYPNNPNHIFEILNALLGENVLTPRGLMLAAAASPQTYINGSEPPFLLLHGDKDDIVPIEQSYLLRDELEKHGSTVLMHTVLGGGHCFDHNSPDVKAVVDNFLAYFLPCGETISHNDRKWK
ncbi:MAG: alpha/beta hydrolase [Defluviitaleaceae bacterium]|nr:alpha/beta hydrolase [Defluviitaleaceae bacterium]